MAVAKGWPALNGGKAPYKAARELSKGSTPHGSLLYFGEASGPIYSFILTFLSLVNAVYASILVGALSIVFVTVFGVGGGIGLLVALLLPSMYFVTKLPSVVADMSVLVSVEDLVRQSEVREAATAQQKRLAGQAVKVLAHLAGSKAMRAAAKLSPEEKRRRFKAAEAELGEEAFRERRDTASRIFRSFLPEGKEELTAANLASLLKALHVIRGDGSPEDQAAVGEALAAMDVDEDDADATVGAGEGEEAALKEEPTISEVEFLGWYITAGPGALTTVDDDIDNLVNNVFRVLDSDSSGDVDLDELRAVLKDIDESIEVEAVLTAWDKDGDGKLSREELAIVFRSSLS